jgi:hypothetical protein
MIPSEHEQEHARTLNYIQAACGKLIVKQSIHRSVYFTQQQSSRPVYKRPDSRDSVGDFF